MNGTSAPAVRILMSAGEVSGDRAAASIAREIRRQDPGCVLVGAGGQHMREAGVDLLDRTAHLGAVGVTEAFAVAPRLLMTWRRMRAAVRREPPDAAVLVANDLFHMLAARRLRALGVPTVTYLAPQSWLWSALAGTVARSFDLILAAFPDEQHVYARAGGHVVFVGHHLVDELSPVTAPERAAARARLGLPGHGRIVGVLPGSRGHEVDRIGPPLLDAAALLVRTDPAVRVVLPVAHEGLRPRLAAMLRARALSDLSTLTDDSLTAMRAADVLLLSSGTATLEAALLGVPMVIAYRVSAVSHVFVKLAIRLGLLPGYVVGLPNIILNRAVVPEVLQRGLTGAAVAAVARAILTDPGRREAMREIGAELASRLGARGTVERAADLILLLAREAATHPGVGPLPADIAPLRHGPRER